MFGLTLVAARTAVSRAPLWAAIGTHLTFLTVNRHRAGGRPARRGLAHTEGDRPPPAVLLVPAYLLLAPPPVSRCADGPRDGVAPTPGGGSARQRARP
ncbi:hypothetical protein SANTM175S_05145 [Streptomyces antimycoticus]